MWNVYLDIPKLGLPPAVVKFVLTEPLDVYFTVELVFLATTIVLGASTYSFATASSLDTKSFNSVSYFSTIDIFSLFWLFFSFKSFTIFSAYSKFAT